MPLVIHPRLPKRFRYAAVLAAAVCFAAPAAAQAACDPVPTVKAFQPFGDSSDYFLADNGGFESGTAGWRLTNASVVAGNESYFLNGRGDTHSLSIAPGGRAVSSPICIDTTRTGYRFFAQQARSATAPNLRVSILWAGSAGPTRYVRVDTLAGANHSSWAPSRFWAPQLAAQLFQRLGLTAEDTATVRLVFQVDNTAGPAWRIDDLYIDPFRAG
ncbi:MAG TPA: hypothetical protein VFM58_14925 [Solirubrobacteraceae bacterium]|nr:hypothetical protein [Solirubrobacteraceae bacterium]